MNYLDRVKWYYKGFSNSSTTNINGKEKNNISISGRITKRNVLFWLVVCIFFLVVQLANISKVSSEISIVNYVFVIFLALVSIIATIITSKKVYKKLEHKPLNLDLYKRDLPSKLKPVHVRMLLNDGLIDNTSLYATLLDLIDRGFVNIKRVDKELILVRNNKSDEELLEFEKFLLNWLFIKYGNGNEVSSSQIKYNLKNDVNKEKPCEIFNYFQNRVWISFPLNRYYKILNEKGTNRLIYMILFVVGFIKMMHIWSLPMIIYGLGCLLFASPIYILNDRGIEEKDNWLDFKKHLIDFSNIKDKTTEMVKIWNFYLTYSIILDIDSVASKEIKDIFNDDIYNNFQSNIKNIQESNIVKNTNEKYIIPELEIDGTIEKEVLEQRKKYNLE